MIVASLCTAALSRRRSPGCPGAPPSRLWYFRAGLMRRSAHALALGFVFLLGCAQGSDADDGTGRGDGGIVPRRDGAISRDGAAGRDAPSASCTDEGHGSTCEGATDLGSVDPGGMVESMAGVLPSPAAEDWFLVGFPSLGMPNMAGGGEPRIEFTLNDGDVFRIEVRSTCAATLACGDGRGARDLLSWSFVDDRSPMDAEMSGDSDFTTRDMPWPSPVYVRVYRAIGAADCQQYQLRVTR